MRPISEEYQRYLESLGVRRLRVACVLAITLVPVTGVLDYFTHPEFLVTFFYIRVVGSPYLKVCV